jgi:hypothetical protein
MKKSTKKTAPRRLVLTRETLRALDERAFQPVVGGASTPDTICVRCRLDASADTCFDCPPA